MNTVIKVLNCNIDISNNFDIQSLTTIFYMGMNITNENILDTFENVSGSIHITVKQIEDDAKAACGNKVSLATKKLIIYKCIKAYRLAAYKLAMAAYSESTNKEYDVGIQAFILDLQYDMIIADEQYRENKE